MQVNPSLIINEFDVGTDTQMIKGRSEAWQLSLSISPQRGEMTEAQVRGPLHGLADESLTLARRGWLAAPEAPIECAGAIRQAQTTVEVRM
jgi:hypothetical protein